MKKDQIFLPGGVSSPMFVVEDMSLDACPCCSVLLLNNELAQQLLLVGSSISERTAGELFDSLLNFVDVTLME